MYARADDVLRKSEEELKLLAQAGLFALHIGLESGSNAVLDLHTKGQTAEDVEQALHLLDRCGIHYHLTAIPGLGGREYSREHAVKTAALISRHTPLSVWCIGLKIWPNTPLAQMVENGEFSPLSWEEILREERELGIEKQDMFALIFSGLITILPVVLLILLAIFAVIWLLFL